MRQLIVHIVCSTKTIDFITSISHKHLLILHTILTWTKKQIKKISIKVKIASLPSQIMMNDLLSFIVSY